MRQCSCGCVGQTRRARGAVGAYPAQLRRCSLSPVLNQRVTKRFEYEHQHCVSNVSKVAAAMRPMTLYPNELQAVRKEGIQVPFAFSRRGERD